MTNPCDVFSGYKWWQDKPVSVCQSQRVAFVYTESWDAWGWMGPLLVISPILHPSSSRATYLQSCVTCSRAEMVNEDIKQDQSQSWAVKYIDSYWPPTRLFASDYPILSLAVQ